MIRKPYRIISLLFLIVILLAACSPDSTLLTANNSQIIRHGSSFGQTFTAQNDGLSGVSVLLGPSPNPSRGSFVFHLKTNPQSEEDIASAYIPISGVDHKGYYQFNFPPIDDSEGNDYFFNIEIDGDGGGQIFTGEAEAYLDGALYIDQIPQDAQLGFYLDYDYEIYLFGLSKLIVQWIGALCVGIFSFILPGWAIFSLLWPGWEKVNWPSKLGLSGALSLAIYPLFMLWTNLIGLHLFILYALLPPVVSIFVLIWKNQKSFRNIASNIRQKKPIFDRQKLPAAQANLADISFMIIFILIIASRFWVIRSLDVPLFGDSYQHTMISQLIVDHGGLFNSWEPYTNLVTFTYHFGFHSSVAVFHWISGVSLVKSMLWTGQLINILAIIGLYPIAYKITNNRWAGVIAMLIGGLLSPMPMYYVNWGRYTQLAGQAVLPAVIWCAWSIMERPSPVLSATTFLRKLTSWHNLSLDYGSLGIIWLSLGGLALTHYRVLIVAILFFPAFVIFHYTFIQINLWLGRVAWIGLGGMFLFLPWFIRAFSGKILNMFAAQMTKLPSRASSLSQLSNSVGNIQVYLPLFIWLLLLFCVVWGFWKRNRDISVLAIWWFLILVITNLNLIGLPGSDVITNFAIFIALYIPASVIIGSVLTLMLNNVLSREIIINQPLKSDTRVLLINSALAIMICIFGLWGLSNRLKDLHLSSFALITRPDMRAMTWIREKLPEDADFLVNSFFAFNNSMIVGSDGGWWIPLLTGRKTSLPPLTYGFEEGVRSATADTANSLAREIQDKGINNPDVISLLLQKGIEYLYIGQKQGTINYSGPKILDPEVISTSDHFKEIYHQDRVWIFEILP